jgi:hypothetical protein
MYNTIWLRLIINLIHLSNKYDKIRYMLKLKPWAINLDRFLVKNVIEY